MIDPLKLLANPLHEERILVCPACSAWQLHVGVLAAIQFSAAELEEHVEAVLRWHVAQECPYPRLILELLKGGGRLAL